MLLRTKFLSALLLLLSISLLILTLHLHPRRGASSTGWFPALKGQPIVPCSDKLDWLASLDLTYPIRYAHRDIILNPIPNFQRQSITKADTALFPHSQTLDLTKDSKVELQHCKKPLVLEVPAFVQGSSDASHVIFGISTTLERLENSITQLLRWLPRTNAKLFATVIESEQLDEVKAVKADPQKKADLQSRMRGLGMDATLVDPLRLQETFSEKYFSLVEIIYSNRNENTQWISLMDDDTFFPSMPALVSMLGKYDPHEQYYIGGLSEEWWVVTHYGLMGFGGAGIFLSLAMAEAMHENYQYCKETSHASAGDVRIMECIYLLSETKLTNERDLHQIDVHADLSGIFESGGMPLSLHHWRPRAAVPRGYNLPMMHLVADVCGDCFLQRWQFGSDMVLTNGYSIAFYPKGDLKGADMDKMEETWDSTPGVEGSNNHGTDHSLGPTRRKLKLDEEKIQYKLIDSAVVEGGVRQSYLHPGVDGDIDSVLEIFWMGDTEVDH
ncbi:hypothetical protein MMC28_009613 [Mycoblastus sanguinarius]|nr:hypothetical protein [Mycoblastus sanguinarius]